MTSYLGEIFSVSCALVWAVAVIFLRTASIKVPALELNILKNSVGVLLFAGTFLVMGFDQFQGLDSLSLVLLGVSAVLGITIADTAFLKALSILGASRNAVLDCLYSPFVIVLSVIFLNETFGWGQAAGFVLVLGGVFLATSSSHRDPVTRRQLWTGLGYGTLSMFTMAIGLIISKPILADTSPIAVAGWRLLIGLLGGVIWMLVSGRAPRSVKVFRGPIPWLSILMGSFLGSWLALIVWMAGLKYTLASTASILNQTSIIFIVILAALFLHEPIGWKKALGTGMGFCGIAVVFLLT